MIYNLSKTSKEFRELWTEIDEAEGEVTPEQMKRLGDLDGSQQEKFQYTCYALINEQARVAAYKMETDRLKKESQISENKIKALKDYMSVNMEFSNTKKVETELFKITRCKNSQPSISPIEPLSQQPHAVKILYLMGSLKVPLDDLPPQIRPWAELSLNRDRILTYHKLGKKIAGINIVHGHHVRVR